MTGAIDAANAPRATPGYDQFTKSALYFDLAFDEDTNAPVVRPQLPSGTSLRENWTRRRLLDKDSALPDAIAALLLDTIDAARRDSCPCCGVMR